jgi:hypothetical protein
LEYLEITSICRHSLRMAEGWCVTTTRSDPNGGPDLQGRFLVRVSNRRKATALVQSSHPDAMVLANQEATVEQFEKYGVKPGEVMVIWEAQ